MSLAGSFLVARPSLLDPNFARTVVFLLAHSEDGAFGLVVNRPAHAQGLPWPLFTGGPCSSPGLLMLHGHPEWVERPAEDDAEDAEDPEDAEVEEGGGERGLAPG